MKQQYPEKREKVETFLASHFTSDWHIHSRNSCDEACMEVPVLIRMAADKGIRDYGLTDHIHTPFNLPDLAASRKEFLESKPPPNFH